MKGEEEREHEIVCLKRGLKFKVQFSNDLLEAKDSIDEEDPSPTSSTWSYIKGLGLLGFLSLNCMHTSHSSFFVLQISICPLLIIPYSSSSAIRHVSTSCDSHGCCHSLISSGDNHLQAFGFLPVQLSFSTPIVTHSIKLVNI